MSTEFDVLLERIRSLSPAQRREVARAAGVSEQLPGKLVHGQRSNPRVMTIKPLLDYFAAVDRGQAVLPAGGAAARPRPDRLASATAQAR